MTIASAASRVDGARQRTRGALRRRRISLSASLVGLALAAGVGLTWAEPATAAADPPPVSWSVAPADENGVDGRRAIEVDLDPGATVEEHVAIRNDSDREVVFTVTAADGFFTRSGRFDMLTEDEPSVDAGTWISAPDTVSVPAGATAVVPLSIEVPASAEPGDHAAGIAASIRSLQQNADGTTVAVDSRIGVRVLVRVNGTIAPSASLAEASGTYLVSWNPVRPGSATVAFDVVNDGNTRLLAIGTVSVAGRVVPFPRPGAAPEELLPGDVRTVSVDVPDVWPVVVAPATVSLQPSMPPTDDAEGAVPAESVTADTIVWAVPWSQLLVVAGIVLLASLILRARRRARRRLAALLALARDEGRREAASDDPTRVST